MNSLGIYFGPKTINIVEAKGKKLINNIQIPQSSIVSGDLDEQVPLEVKLVAIFNDEFRKNKIDAKQATLCLSGKDLIIRTFEIPVLPSEEIPSVISFEAKKYIPFKVEELIVDYQVELDRASRKNSVLYIGIKKETLDKYLAVFAQLNIKILSIEYSAFSMMRSLRLAGGVDSGINAVVAMDAHEEDEASFTVFENNFPLFSRDFSIGSTGPEAGGVAATSPAGTATDKLKSEIKVSLDYYLRKFPNKKIKKVFLVANQEYLSDIESFIKEVGMVPQFVDSANLARVTGKGVPYSLSFIKGYSVALAEGIKSGLKVDLVAVKEKAKAARELPFKAEGVPFSLEGLSIDFRVVFLGILLCAGVYGWGWYQMKPVHQEIQDIIGKRAEVTSVSPEATYDELEGINVKYKKKLETLNNLVTKQLYMTTPLNVIPGALTDGLWLTRFGFNKQESGEMELNLDGVIYLADSNKEFQGVNDFISNLKNDPTFSSYFKDIRVSTMDRRPLEKVMVTNFTITCKGKQGGK
jgi:Tfp pilus assembly PilM family ATPase